MFELDPQHLPSEARADLADEFDALELTCLDLFDSPLATCPMLVEGLLFTLICFIITALSLSLDEEDSEGALSYLS